MADIGAGYGWSSVALAKHFTSSTVDSFDLDKPSIERAKKIIEAEGLQDCVQAHCKDAGTIVKDPNAEPYDLVMAFQCVHDISDPISVLRTMKQLAGENGTVIVVDMKVANDFRTALAKKDPFEQSCYGFSCMCCLADSKVTRTRWRQEP